MGISNEGGISSLMVKSGAKNRVKKLAQLGKPRTPASANGLVTSLTKKIPVKTKNIAPMMYAVGVVK